MQCACKVSDGKFPSVMRVFASFLVRVSECWQETWLQRSCGTLKTRDDWSKPTRLQVDPAPCRSAPTRWPVTCWLKPDRTGAVAACIIHKTTATLIGFAKRRRSTLCCDVSRVQVSQVQVDLKNTRQIILVLRFKVFTSSNKMVSSLQLSVLF